MKVGLKFLIWVAGVLILVGVGYIAWTQKEAGRGGAKPMVSESVVLMRGNFRQFTYAISDTSEGNKKLAQFDPALVVDESVVLGALKSVANDAYGLRVPETTQPVVETRRETNYVTFAMPDRTLWFELYRNSGGEVGAVRFWVEGE